MKRFHFENWQRHLKDTVFIDLNTCAYVVPHYSTTTESFELKNKYPMQVQKSPFRDQGIVYIRVSISANCLATLAVSYKLQPLQCFGLPGFHQLVFPILVRKVRQSLSVSGPVTHRVRRWFLGDP